MGTRVLVVDDDPLVGELIEGLLESAEMHADVVNDSQEAAARLQKEKFDIVFLDLHMPDPNGIELARRVRSSGVNKRSLIVMITGDESPGALAESFQAGANFFLFKPIEKNRLLRVIRASGGAVLREKRRFQRVEVCCKVALEWNHDKLEGTTLDVSLGGMLVQAARTFPEGSRVDVKLVTTAGRPPVQATGRVVRVFEHQRMGIELMAMGMTDSERLQEFLLPHILGVTEPTKTAAS